MPTHFAYPNVLPREDLFIGCGRYTVILPGQALGDGYREIAETPNTPNRTQLEYALQILSPDSYDADRLLVEKQDDPKRRYRGNSLDLAYFLAHTYKSREMNLRISDDIWCTGVIEVKDGTPFLRKVDATGFRLKMSHFLSPANPDSVFIVPAANMQKESVETATARGAGVVSVRQLADGADLCRDGAKTILKVLPGELPALLSVIFQPCRRKTGRKKWIAGALAGLACLLAGLWFFGRPDAPDAAKIEQLLQNGQLSAAKQAIARVRNNSPMTEKIRALMNRSCDIELTMAVQRAGQAAVEKIQVPSEASANLSLSNEDDYRLVISTADPPEKAYVYIFQIDQSGRAYCVFPNVKWKLENPVEAGQWPLVIPEGGEEWLFLDQLPAAWKDGMKETIHLLVSPWRANDIESIFNKVDTETDRNARKRLIEKLKNQLIVRKKTGISSLAYLKVKFFHK
ncbi:MAG: hypothetical protein DSY90_06445 [Deltaproteobacteria bacterium]|nr:MAG: hypothetical protein DSY90_06445 [Deltaproteobacteria bacterium]